MAHKIGAVVAPLSRFLLTSGFALHGLLKLSITTLNAGAPVRGGPGDSRALDMEAQFMFRLLMDSTNPPADHVFFG